MMPPDYLQHAATAINVRVETAMHTDLAYAVKGCDPLLHEILHFVLFNGGKRVRPLLAVLCSRSCGVDNDELYLLATAFEYLHVATLVHDDIIDRAEQRRGKETVNARYGTAAAILAGDWLHARSMYLIGTLAGSAGLDYICQATTSMVNGEFEQIRLTGDLAIEETSYFQVIRQKTGNLIASTCAIGALYAKATPVQLQAFISYGNHIGVAFQVVDDLLDFLGNDQITGKQGGRDFLEGKITLPFLRAYQQGSAEDKKVFMALLQGDRSAPEAFSRLHDLICRLGGFESATATARQLISQAIEALRPLTGPGTHTADLDRLIELAHYILHRTK